MTAFAPRMTRIERQTHDELTRLGVQFTFDLPSHRHPGVYYQPDFKIIAAPPELKLPAFVETKPQEFLYEFFQDIGGPRMYGERFTGKRYHKITAQWMLDYGGQVMQEFAKPKQLAEQYNVQVLIIGSVNATSRLSILMTAEHAVFDREHPFVCQEGVRKKEERKLKEADYRAKWETERLVREQQQAEYLRQQQALIPVYKRLATASRRTNDWDNRCCCCGESTPAGTGSLFRHDERWLVVCPNCA